jgi:hypothetical protein
VSNVSSKKLSLDEIYTLIYKLSPSEVVAKFVEYNIKTAITKPITDVVAIFYFGRENLIPQMFERFINQSSIKSTQYLKYYLQRHIEIDSEDHGPKMLKLLNFVTNNNTQNIKNCINIGIDSIIKRTELWDNILIRLN